LRLEGGVDAGGAWRVVLISGKRWRMFCAVRGVLVVVLMVVDIVHLCTEEWVAKSEFLREDFWGESLEAQC
jgi:hypothetical protein